MHELRHDFRLFYRIWYCGIVSQITFCGIIVEIIWSYNQYNFFFWLQVYSVYSLYTSLTGIFHSSYERYWPIVIILFGILVSRMLHMIVKMILSGTPGISIGKIISSAADVVKEAPGKPSDWIGP